MALNNEVYCVHVFSFPDVMLPVYKLSRWWAAFYIVYISLELFLFLNLVSSLHCFFLVYFDTLCSLVRRNWLKSVFFFVSCFNFSFSFSLVDENLLNFSFSFSHFWF